MKTILRFLALLLPILAGNLPARAESPRIVVLSSTAWDFVKELGLANRVVGRAENVEADELKGTASVGRSDGVNLEAVMGLKPDVVVGSPQYHSALAGPIKGAGAKLELISIKKWEEVPAELQRLGAALGVGEAAAKADKLRATMASTAVKTPAGLKVVVVVNAEPLLVASAGSYSADLIRLAGGDASSIADAPGGQFRGFVQFSDEKLLELNPDVILLSRWRGADQLDAALAGKPFWKGLRAVRAGAVKVVEADQLYTVPGPRGIATVAMLKEWFSTLKK